MPRTNTYEQWDVVAHHQLDDVRKRRALGEIDEVLQAEGEIDVLVHFDANAVRDVVPVIVFRLALLSLLGGLLGL